MAAKLTVAMVSTLRVPGKYNKPLLSDLGGDNPPLTLAYKFSRPSADLCGFLSSAWLTATHLAQHEVPGVHAPSCRGEGGGREAEQRAALQGRSKKRWKSGSVVALC